MVRKKAPTKKKTSTSRKSTPRRAQKARPLHKRVMLHPFSVFIFLCVGVLLIAWTLKAAAVNIKVTARVAGTTPSISATIDSPAGNDRFSSLPVAISGTCPASSYVSIYSNGVELGSALCSVVNDFSLSIGLLPGQNELVAHVYNLADNEGPESGVVNVFYDISGQPPSNPPLNPQPTPATGSNSGPVSQSPSKSNSPKATAEPFLIQTEFNTQGYYVGDKVEWPLTISGGIKPYAVNVDWGDGTNTVYSRSDDGDFDIDHAYSEPGPNQGSYTIKISASDSDSTKAYLEFFVFVSKDKNPMASGSTSANQSGTGASLGNEEKSFWEENKWLVVAWPSYATISLMGASFWLGERQEFLKLHRRRH